MNEILALEDKDFGNDLLIKSDRIINILENQEKWMKKEKIFWEWMVTHKYIYQFPRVQTLFSEFGVN